MNAVRSIKSVVFFRLAFTSAVSVCVLQSPGCSGTVITSQDSRNADGGVEPNHSNGGAGGGTAPGRRGTGGAATGKGGSAPGYCGDGVIDPGEECDGANLNYETCYSLTMGAEPNGTLSCSACMFNLSNCYGNGTGRGGSAGMIGYTGGRAGYAGYAGYAGFAGSYGGRSAGGSAGMMGVDPAAVCYAGGGVPEPGNPNNCLSGSSATSVCLKDYIGNRFSSTEPIDNGSCAAGCGCTGCAAQYDKCATSPDCIYILDCVERTKCTRMVDCYQPATCQNVIDSVGGSRSRAAIDMSNLLPCMMGYGCSVSCY